MCTGFAIYKNNPIYGMNFDFIDVDIKIDIFQNDDTYVFQLMFKIDNDYVPTAGYNSKGLFASAQVMISELKTCFSENETLINPYDVYINSMKRAGDIGYVINEVIGKKRLNYSGYPKGHQLYAAKNGKSVIIEPGENSNVFIKSENEFVVMTNFPNYELLSKDIKDITGFGIDRYITATRMIQNNVSKFDYKFAFDILKRTLLTAGEVTTQCSFVVDQESSNIFLSLRKDFDKIWKISLCKRTIETFNGFSKHVKLDICEGGVTEKSLSQYYEHCNV